MKTHRADLSKTIHDLIAIGGSTGGTAATAALLSGFPASCPPIVIVQDIHPELATSYTSWLARSAPMEVRSGRDGDPIEPGVAVLAKCDRHLRVVRNHNRLCVALDAGDYINGHRPSIDVLFASIATLDHVRAAAVLLTGTGSDGARGLLALRRRGVRTFVQEPAECVAPAMPNSAIRLGAAEHVLPLSAIARAIIAA